MVSRQYWGVSAPECYSIHIHIVHANIGLYLEDLKGIRTYSCALVAQEVHHQLEIFHIWTNMQECECMCKYVYMWPMCTLARACRFRWSHWTAHMCQPHGTNRDSSSKSLVWLMAFTAAVCMKYMFHECSKLYTWLERMSVNPPMCVDSWVNAWVFTYTCEVIHVCIYTYIHIIHTHMNTCVHGIRAFFL